MIQRHYLQTKENAMKSEDQAAEGLTEEQAADMTTRPPLRKKAVKKSVKKPVKKPVKSGKKSGKKAAKKEGKR